METVSGDKATKDLFENLDITWNRLPGGAAVGEIVKQALDSFVPAHPEALLPELVKARPLIAAIVASTKDPLAERKLKELDETIALCSGLWLEAQSDKAAVSPGATLRVNFTAIQRLPDQVALTGIRLTGMEGAPTVNLAPTVLVNNQPSRYNTSFTVPQNQPYTQPYWLEQPKDGALYSVPDPREIGLPEDAPVLEAHFRVQVAGVDLELTRPVQYRYVDRVYGEQVRPFTVIPPVAVSLSEHAIVFGDAKPRRIEVAVRSNGGKAAGDLRLDVPTGWTAEPASSHFELTASEEQTNVFFNLIPPAGDSRGKNPRHRASGHTDRLHRHRGDPVSAHHHADAPAAGRSDAGARRYPHPLENRRLCDGSGRRRAAGHPPARLRSDSVDRSRPGSWRSGALRRDRHRRTRIQHAAGSARELPAAVRLRE